MQPCPPDPVPACIIAACQVLLVCVQQCLKLDPLIALHVPSSMHLHNVRVQHWPESPDEASCVIITSCFSCAQHCLDLNSPDPGVGELLKLVCKAFYSATYMGVPPYLLRPHPFAQWMTCFHTLLLRPVPKVRSALLRYVCQALQRHGRHSRCRGRNLAVPHSADQASAQRDKRHPIKLHGIVMLWRKSRCLLWQCSNLFPNVQLVTFLPRHCSVSVPHAAELQLTKTDQASI